MNRRERREARAAMRTLARMSIDELFEDTKKRVREAFGRIGHEDVGGGFHCVTEDGELFVVPGSWGTREERDAAFPILRNAFRARKVVRYVYVTEAWASAREDVRPTLDPERKEMLFIHAADRNGRKLTTAAFIARSNGAATLSEWQDGPPIEWGFLELIDDAASDLPTKGIISGKRLDSYEEFEDAMAKSPPRFREGMIIVHRLREAFADDLAQSAQRKIIALFQVLLMLALHMKGCDINPTDLRTFASGFSNAPDVFPMFAGDVLNNQPSIEDLHCAQERVVSILDNLGIEPSPAVADAMVNFALNIGARGAGIWYVNRFCEQMADDLGKLAGVFPTGIGYTS